MRNAKYRGKACYSIDGICKKGEWMYGALVPAGCESANPWILGNIWNVNRDNIKPEFWVQVDGHTVHQYIGVTDKSNYYIFEGDIVKFNYETTAVKRHGIFGCVCFNKDACGYYIKTFIDGHVTYASFVECHALEIIGTIVDNPEIFEEW